MGYNPQDSLENAINTVRVHVRERGIRTTCPLRENFPWHSRFAISRSRHGNSSWLPPFFLLVVLRKVTCGPSKGSLVPCSLNSKKVSKMMRCVVENKNIKVQVEMMTLPSMNILLMVQKSGDHQLRLVVYPIIYKGLAPYQVVVWDFFRQ